MSHLNSLIQSSVEDFAELMKTVLHKNAYKGPWNDVSVQKLLGKLAEEYDELSDAVISQRGVDVVRAEAADLANVAMMLAENYAKQHEPPKGEHGNSN